MLPYGVEGERDASLDVSNELENRRISMTTGTYAVTHKCFDSSRAILVKSEKKAGGRLGCAGPKRAIISQLDKSLNI